MKQTCPEGVFDGTGIVLCPHCMVRLTPRADLCGKRVSCPHCRKPLMVPQAAAVAESMPGLAAVSETESGSKAEPPRLIPVICRVCSTRMYADPQQVGATIRCPDCYVDNVVRPPVEAAPGAKRTVHRSYGVVDDDSPATRNQSSTTVPANVTQQDDRSRKQAVDYLFVACPQCATRMHFAPKHAGRQAQCPDCNTRVVIPQPKPGDRRRASRSLQQGQYDVGEITTDQPASELPAPKKWTERPLDETSKPASRKPRWTFFSGVFLFPWRADVVLQWLYLSAGILVVGLLLAFIAGLYQQAEDGSKMGGIAMAFPAASLIWVTILTVTYGGACSWSVLRDTSAGTDTIEEWPTADWQVWVYPLLYLLYLASLAAAIGYAVQWAANTPPGLSQAIAAVVLTPVLLLSTLETGHVLSVFSGPVLGSLLRSWRWWALYYLLNTLLLVAAAAIVIGVNDAGSPYLAGVIAAPLLSATWLIAARLLGRLAWRIEARQ